MPHIRSALGRACLGSAIAVAPACSDPPIDPTPSDASAQADAWIDAGSGDSTAPIDEPSPIEELPPIDVAAPDKRIIDLTASELKLLCDWNAREYGGYGGSLHCTIDASFPSIGAPIGVQDCLDTLEIWLWGRQCPLTVQDYMECVGWQVQEVCSVKDGGGWPQSCLTQQGPLCIGGIGKEAQAPPDAEAGASDAVTSDAGDATTRDAAPADLGDSASPGD